MQAAGRGEGGLRLAQPLGQGRDERGRDRQRALDRRRLDRDRLERALAADAAGGGRVERPRQPAGVEPGRIELDRVRGEIVRQVGRRAGAAPRRARIRARAPRRDPACAWSRPPGLPPIRSSSGSSTASRSSTSSPPGQPEHADDGGTVRRWRLPLPRHRAATVPARLRGRRSRRGTDDAAARRWTSTTSYDAWIDALRGAGGLRAARDGDGRPRARRGPRHGASRSSPGARRRRSTRPRWTGSRSRRARPPTRR